MRQEAMTYPKFVFVHLPKTGGSTFAKMLKRTYKHRMKIDTNPGPPKLPNYEQYHVICGTHIPWHKYDHMPLITFVRDPIERVISHYFFFKGHDPNTGGWRRRKVNQENLTVGEFSAIVPNMMTYFAGSDPGRYEFIGVLERWDESVQKFQKLYGINLPVVEKVKVNRRNKEPVSAEDRTKIAVYQQEDIKLYERIINEF